MSSYPFECYVPLDKGPSMNDVTPKESLFLKKKANFEIEDLIYLFSYNVDNFWFLADRVMSPVLKIGSLLLSPL